MPTAQPLSAAANHTQPCSEPDATPPTKAPILQPKPRRAPQPISNPPTPAASSDFAGGQADAAKGLVAAAASAPFARNPWPPLKSIAAAALGGLLMGWGARLGFGCNIGAFVGGVASGSLHGWVWFAAALPGCLIGIRLRPLFGLSRE